MILIILKQTQGYVEYVVILILLSKIFEWSMPQERQYDIVLKTMNFWGVRQS